MNKRQQEQFTAFFEEIYETEEILDFIKIQLNKSQHFNPNRIFDLLAQDYNHITIQDMRNYLHDKVTYNPRQLYQFFERFDWSRQGYISRTDFVNEIMPFGHPIVGDQAGSDGAITAQIQGHFISLLVEISKRLRILQVARKQLVSIQPYDAFAHMDPFKTGLLGINELRKLFYANDFNVNDSQLYYLMHGLRRRAYKHVNLEVFCQNLDPLEFSYYLAYQNQILEQNQTHLMARSRHQEQSIKRSRLQSQRLQHEIQKAQRKRMAELQRQIEIEDGVKAEVLGYEALRQRQMRKAVLQQQQLMRQRMILADDLVRRQENIISNKERDIHALQLQQMRQDRVNQELANSALGNQYALDRSRKQFLRQIQEQNMRKRRQFMQEELELSKQRIIAESRRRHLEEQQHPQYHPQNAMVNNSTGTSQHNRIVAPVIEHNRHPQFQRNSLPAQPRFRVQQQNSRYSNLQSNYDHRESWAEGTRVRNSGMTMTNAQRYGKQLQETRYDIYERKSGVKDSKYSPY